MLKSFLQDNKQEILGKWLDRVWETYPPDARRFLKGGKDQFANPVGSTIAAGLDRAYDLLAEGAADESLEPALDKVMRVRAVQKFTASQAVGFVLELKDIVRKETAGSGLDLSEFEQSVDRAALCAFDIYVSCREQVFEIKANELRNRSAMFVERVNKKYRLMDGKDFWEEPLSKGKAGASPAETTDE